MALTAEQIQNQLEAYLDTDEGKNLLAPMGMQAGGRLVGFAGPDRLTNNEEDKIIPVFASEEVKKVNFFKSLFMSFNYMIWGDV